MNRTHLRELGAIGRSVFSAAVYALLIVTFVGQVARVEGFSMQPTLEDQDRLIVDKLSYVIGSPRPGDVVMLRYPAEPTTMYVKRVMAKPGDLVESLNGVVFVNGVAVPDDYVAAENRSHDDFGPQTIKPGYYFVMGDHRNDSADSRVFGQVPEKYIVGKVKLRWWPLHDAKVF
ncbi:MAG TPA: signal peptidase I [Vicinamibacterales bacterium]|jgi:signal peptidase I|nr:signal peptidase I [Vicinamibacterales bacterium]